MVLDAVVICIPPAITLTPFSLYIDAISIALGKTSTVTAIPTKSGTSSKSIALIFSFSIVTSHS